MEIDGSIGEGGGQILRTSISLSSILQKQIHITNIRAGRPKPGLAHQHKASIEAAGKLCGAIMNGVHVGSSEIWYEPTHLPIAGKYIFDIGTAGSAALVFQTIYPILLKADGVSEVTIKGGTHNPMAPPFEYLSEVLLPQLRNMGINIKLELVSHGFFPEGGGEIKATIHGTDIKPLVLTERGALIKKSITVNGHVPSTTKQIRDELLKELSWKSVSTTVNNTIKGHHSYAVVKMEYANTAEIITGLPEKRETPIKLAIDMSRDIYRWDTSTAPVGEHLSDQLLVPMVIGMGGTYTAIGPSLHLTTNIDVVNMFYPSSTTYTKTSGDTVVINVSVV